MVNSFLKILINFSRKKGTKAYQFLSLIAGTLFFLVILPFIFLLIAKFLNRFISFDLPGEYKIMLVIFSIAFGLFFLLWATITQIKIGKGTPAPMAPTQKLVVSGPYQYTRNPIEFGTLFYYLGFGTFFWNFI